MSVEKLSPLVSGFALAAALAVLMNTALACAKDAIAPLKAFMTSVAGHDWTTQGLFEVSLFVFSGWLFTKTGIAGRMDAARITSLLISSVLLAGAALAIWFTLT